jgi:hypothetical protein
MGSNPDTTLLLNKNWYSVRLFEAEEEKKMQ